MQEKQCKKNSEISCIRVMASVDHKFLREAMLTRENTKENSKNAKKKRKPIWGSSSREGRKVI